MNQQTVDGQTYGITPFSKGREQLIMNKKLPLVLLSVFLCASCLAQDSNLLSAASPKLRQFLADHLEASQALSNVLAEAFATRTVRLYYFYSDNESVARAFHYYPEKSVVGIMMRENQQPCDECMCLIFEMLNSEGEKRFGQLEEKAKDGTVSKEGFVREVLRQEFQAVKKTQALIGQFKLSQKEITESYYYDRFIRCPSEFDEFLSYKTKVSPKRADLKGYYQIYDSLRKTP
jgi:hypothetical protein